MIDKPGLYRKSYEYDLRDQKAAAYLADRAANNLGPEIFKAAINGPIVVEVTLSRDAPGIHQFQKGIGQLDVTVAVMAVRTHNVDIPIFNPVPLTPRVITVHARPWWQRLRDEVVKTWREAGETAEACRAG